MRVEFYGTYRTLAGDKTIEIESEDDLMVSELLKKVCTRIPALQNELFNEHGKLFAYIPVYVNGRNPRLLENGLNTLLHPEDLLSLFSPISSGRMNVEALTEKSQ
jgi:molybdopterin converting factor small subunit